MFVIDRTQFTYCNFVPNMTLGVKSKFHSINLKFIILNCYHLLAASSVGLVNSHDVLLYFSRFCPDDQGFSKIKTFLISF